MRMNSRVRNAVLCVIGVITILAGFDALAHSYTGLYGWAVHHRLGGWQAISWPAEIDVFLVAGELALYVAYLDGWPGRRRVWPWVTAVTGLAVSVAGNVGHIQALPGEPVTVADRLTAAVSPIAAFAGLMIGLLVVKMSGHGADPAPAVVTQGDDRERLLTDAARIVSDARSEGIVLSQRALAAQLRERGHRFSNQALRDIASTVPSTSAASEDLAA
jgi:hypothetical protein